MSEPQSHVGTNWREPWEVRGVPWAWARAIARGTRWVPLSCFAIAISMFKAYDLGAPRPAGVGVPIPLIAVGVLGSLSGAASLLAGLVMVAQQSPWRRMLARRERRCAGCGHRIAADLVQCGECGALAESERLLIERAALDRELARDRSVIVAATLGAPGMALIVAIPFLVTVRGGTVFFVVGLLGLASTIGAMILGWLERRDFKRRFPFAPREGTRP